MKILYVGPLWRGSTAPQRVMALRKLGHQVVEVDTTTPMLDRRVASLVRISRRLAVAWDLAGANKSILRNVKKELFDLIWIDKGLTITAITLRRIKKAYPAIQLVAYSPDDMIHPRNQSRRYLKCAPIYDWHITHKTYNVAELKLLGARNVYFIDKAYDPVAYHPLSLFQEENKRWGSDVGFLGGFERNRYKIMLDLAKSGVSITIRGPSWEPYVGRHPNLIVKPGWVQAEDCAKVYCSTKINLHFLRKVARDLQTARSVEIPACGAFMLAERTNEHLYLFEEGDEAEFFSDFEELQAKVKYYLLHAKKRKQIATAGYQRCLRSGYDNSKRLQMVLDHIQNRHIKE